MKIKLFCIVTETKDGRDCITSFHNPVNGKSESVITHGSNAVNYAFNLLGRNHASLTTINTPDMTCKRYTQLAEGLEFVRNSGDMEALIKRLGMRKISMHAS